MYQGKHLKSRRHNRRRKISVLLASLVLMLVFAIAGTLAYITTDDDPVKNTFTPSQVPISVQEEIKDGTKNNVKIQNEGNTDAYIRAAVIVTWQDKDGNIFGAKPVENTDYSITWSKEYWVLHADGYYYYTNPVAPNNCTGVLFTACSEVSGKAPDGYSLCVEIVAQSIQAKGVDADGRKAVVVAWGVDPESLD